MSKDKTLLEEGTVRRFMKLANMEVIGTNFVNETFTTVDEEPVVEEEAAVYQDDEEEAVELDLDADAPLDAPAEDAEVEMDTEFDAEEDLDEPEADAGELTLTDEEEVDMMENTVNEVARRIALRLQEMKKNSSK